MRTFFTFTICFPIILLLVHASTSGAQDLKSKTNWRVERAALDRSWGERLQEIADWARENGVPQQVPETFKLYQPRDLGRQTIFLPSENSMPEPPEGRLGQWLAKINEAKRWQAGRIFELAKRANGEGAGAAAIQLLYEVLYFDRDHLEVRKILGHRRTNDGWRVSPERITVRAASQPHDLCQWPAQSYLLLVSPHFEIESNASEEQTRHLAEKLERWHDVWRQVFFEYWSSSKTLGRWIAGNSSYRHSKKRFRVVFFKQRNDYLAQLAPVVRGVEVSTGYYSNQERVSFFYDDTDPVVEDTWRHELTHQLFRESQNTGKELFEEQFIWLDEGIATYFESLSDFGEYVTLGGFESRRVQYARIRLLLERFYVPLAELSAIGREDLQQRSDMVRVYSQAAGITGMLMNDQSGAMESGLIEFLKLMYTGRRLKSGTFEELVGSSFEELDARYPKYLVTDAETVAKHLSLPLTRTEMSLPGSNLDEPAFASLGECHELSWIDLSRNTIRAPQIQQLAKCQNLQQIFMTECSLGDGVLESLAQFSQLDELDLSGSSVSDEQLEELTDLVGLKSLRLMTTRVTDDGLAVLANLPKLNSVDLTNCKVTAAGVAKLKQLRPQLEIIQ